MIKPSHICFNPLAGIRCFLTYTKLWGRSTRQAMFQSPSGDSLFSDAYALGIDDQAIAYMFQSPCGDSLFSDQSWAVLKDRADLKVSIPLRGFVVF